MYEKPFHYEFENETISRAMAVNAFTISIE